MKTLLCVLSLWGIGGLAETSVGLPRLGCVRDSRDQLRIVYGTRGSFILSSPIAVDVRSFYCAEDAFAVKTASALIAFDASGQETSRLELAGEASFSGGGETLTAHVAESGRSFFLRERQWAETDSAIPSEPTELKLNHCAVRLEDGRILLCGEPLPDIPPAVSLERMGEDWLQIRTAEGSYALTFRDRGPEVYALPASAPEQDSP